MNQVEVGKQTCCAAACLSAGPTALFMRDSVNAFWRCFCSAQVQLSTRFEMHRTRMSERDFVFGTNLMQHSMMTSITVSCLSPEVSRKLQTI